MLRLNPCDWYESQENYLSGLDSLRFGAQIIDKEYLADNMLALCREKVSLAVSPDNSESEEGWLESPHNAKPFVFENSQFLINSNFDDDDEILESLDSIENLLFQNSTMLIHRDLGLQVTVFKSDFTYVMRDHPFICANLDGLVKLEDGTVLGLEIKSSPYKVGWTEFKIPWYYWNQIQHYMLVTGLKQFFVVAEVCGKTLVRRVRTH